MNRVVTATEARVRFGELMRRVAGGGGAVVVEKDGEPQVVVLSLEEYAQLQEAQGKRAHWRDQVEHARRLIAEDLGERRLPAAEDIVRELREERDAQLMGLR
jgi:prevent-host-death family protein